MHAGIVLSLGDGTLLWDLWENLKCKNKFLSAIKSLGIRGASSLLDCMCGGCRGVGVSSTWPSSSVQSNATVFRHISDWMCQRWVQSQWLPSLAEACVSDVRATERERVSIIPSNTFRLNNIVACDVKSKPILILFVISSDQQSSQNKVLLIAHVNCHSH